MILRNAIGASLLVAVGVVLAQAASAAGSAAPDISGPWLPAHAARAIKDSAGHAPPLNAAGLAAYQQHQSDAKADPLQRCLPPGLPRVMLQKGFPFNIIQGESMYAFMFQWNHLNRVVYMNQPHFESIGPQYFGQSIGHWDGDILVIETNGYNDTTYLDDSGLPHSDQLETVEKVSLLPGGRKLRDEVTLTDPKYFEHPWTTVLEFAKSPGTVIEEDYCLGRTGQNSLRQIGAPGTP